MWEHRAQGRVGGGRHPRGFGLTLLEPSLQQGGAGACGETHAEGAGGTGPKAPALGQPWGRSTPPWRRHISSVSLTASVRWE